MVDSSQTTMHVLKEVLLLRHSSEVMLQAGTAPALLGAQSTDRESQKRPLPTQAPQGQGLWPCPPRLLQAAAAEQWLLTGMSPPGTGRHPWPLALCSFMSSAPFP